MADRPDHILKLEDLKAANKAENLSAQTKLEQHYGFPQSDDLLVLSHVASKCSTDWQADDTRRGIEAYTKNVIDTAKDRVEQANLHGYKYTLLYEAGQGTPHWQPDRKDPWVREGTISWTPPPLNQQAKDILAGVNKIPNIKAELRTFKDGAKGVEGVPDEGTFYIVAWDTSTESAEKKGKN